MINLCTWNVRGLNDPQKAREIKKFIEINKLQMVGLVETKVRPHNSGKVQKRLKKGWHWINNNAASSRGRIWIGWNPVEVMVLGVQAWSKLFIVRWKSLT